MQLAAVQQERNRIIEVSLALASSTREAWRRFRQEAPPDEGP